MSNGPFISSWRTDMSPDCERDDPADRPQPPECPVCGADCDEGAAFCSRECQHENGREDAAMAAAELGAES